jgi:hypothetical protein
MRGCHTKKFAYHVTLFVCRGGGGLGQLKYALQGERRKEKKVYQRGKLIGLPILPPTKKIHE